MTAWSVLCDFDGTITTDDVTDTLLEAFGKPGWRESENEWLAGRMGSRECLRQQIACLDASREELNRVIDSIEVDEFFSMFADIVTLRGWDFSIVSDGLDYAIERVLRRHNLPALPFYANSLSQSGERAWRLDFPHQDTMCCPASGVCKCAFARRARAAGRKVLVIGDGRSDFCVAGCADLVFAKGTLLTHCFDKNLPHIPISGFWDAVRIVPVLFEQETALT
ncbi:MAG: MtnX-like HAD-IB family phosphatase, partial [Zoogloeaceae bacterium]|nr:MtnX-like HAD-IB family phosphatase [Zoogloeaceae bacterium]